MSAAAVLVAMVVAGACYQALGARLDGERLKPPGTLVQVGHTRMHMVCEGEGSPTVVLEAGSMGFSSTWAWLRPEIARFTRVCAYDRAGLGWSEPRSAPRDASTIARELHDLLEGAGEQGPFILAGHSLGGVYVRAFAECYPDRVAGVLFLDSSHPDQLEGMSDRQQALFRYAQYGMSLLPVLARFGILRATNLLGRVARDLPPADYRAVQAFAASLEHLRASLEELRAWDATMAQARANRSLGDRPVSVVHAGNVKGVSPDMVALMERLHEDLTALSTRSRYRAIEDANHYSILMSPKFVPAVVEEIRWLVEQWRAR